MCVEIWHRKEIKVFKVVILQKRPINEQIDKNIETIIMAMEEASENHADILLLPKCFITGYNLPMSHEKVFPMMI